jgi:hypothetical protein
VHALLELCGPYKNSAALRRTGNVSRIGIYAPMTLPATTTIVAATAFPEKQ